MEAGSDLKSIAIKPMLRPRETKIIRRDAQLRDLPEELFEHCETLNHLDLSGNELSRLPDDFIRFRHLKILFLSDNRFSTFPIVLGKLPALEMIAFRNNNMKHFPEESIPRRLRWLILTNNQLTRLPRALGAAYRLQKLMLAGNVLSELPAEYAELKRLELLRLSVNQFRTLPGWLFSLPSLSFLTFAGNPCSQVTCPQATLPQVDWGSLLLLEQLGEGASGTIWKAQIMNHDGQKSVGLAVKIFKGELTSDGSPDDEFCCCILAGYHPNIPRLEGQITKHPDGKKGLVFQLIPSNFRTLGLPPSLQTCTRDCFAEGQSLTAKQGLTLLLAIASSLVHLHQKGICHGDLCNRSAIAFLIMSTDEIDAHNILLDSQGNSFLGDYGAATYYKKTFNASDGQIERLEVRAFGLLLDDVIRLLNGHQEVNSRDLVDRLMALKDSCMVAKVMDRPNFSSIVNELYTWHPVLNRGNE